MSTCGRIDRPAKGDKMTRATRKGHGITDDVRIVYGGTDPKGPSVGGLAGLTGTTRVVPYSGVLFIPDTGEKAGVECWIGGVATKFWAVTA